MAPANHLLVAQLETSLLRVWPSQHMHVQRGWAIRSAHGYSGRANSASAIVQNAVLDEAMLDHVTDYFDRHQLPTIFRISPLCAPKASAWLKARGFTSRGVAHTMIATLAPAPLVTNPDVRLEPQATDAWIAATTTHQTEHSKRNPAALKSIVSRIEVPACFASVLRDGAAVGFGMAAIDNNWAEISSIVIDQSNRGKGFGRRLVTSLLSWARQQGATNAFLQVDTNNTAAINLYSSLGFATLYDYDTLLRRRET